MKFISVKTRVREELIDITDLVIKEIKSSGVKNGICILASQHTTAGLTINENADPSVKRDILNQLAKTAPEGAGYLHMEGNSDSHIKASLMGLSLQLIVEDSSPVLGTWQGIYFCEFDGPRTRKVAFEIISKK